MDIKLKIRTIKQFLKVCPNETIAETLTWRNDDQIHELEIDHFSDAEFDALLEVLEKSADPGAKTATSKITSYRSIQQDPSGKKVARLEMLEQALRLFISKQQNHWLFSEENGFMIPRYVSNIEYHPYDARSETPAHCNMRLVCISRGEHSTKNKEWGAEDIRGGRTVVEILAGEKLYVPTKELMEAYEKTMTRYKEVQRQTGQQFTADGEGASYDGRYRDEIIAMVRDGIAAKLVMDDVGNDDKDGPEFGDEKGLASNSFWCSEKEEASNVALPVYPNVKLFDLDRHNHVVVHSDQLKDYQWNPKLGDKLILPAEHKDLVQILMDTAAEDIDDIIAGKSGGTIVICTGPPGTGKTLTAEVTSEVIKRPLYKVQCSQLGTDEETIEKKLRLVLSRSTRWKALLLIDEADVYVRERGDDIQQNAIVGVFLRILEYYRGVLFLTSNKATVIDDAIMSRSTAHLKYSPPDADELNRIWRVLSDQFGLKLTDEFIEKAVATFPEVVGRDVKSILKLAIRFSRRNDEGVTIKLLRKLAVHKDIKVK